MKLTYLSGMTCLVFCLVAATPVYAKGQRKMAVHRHPFIPDHWYRLVKYWDTDDNSEWICLKNVEGTIRGALIRLQKDGKKHLYVEYIPLTARIDAGRVYISRWYRYRQDGKIVTKSDPCGGMFYEDIEATTIGHYGSAEFKVLTLPKTWKEYRRSLAPRLDGLVWQQPPVIDLDKVERDLENVRRESQRQLGELEKEKAEGDKLFDDALKAVPNPQAPDSPSPNVQ